MFCWICWIMIRKKLLIHPPSFICNLQCFCCFITYGHWTRFFKWSNSDFVCHLKILGHIILAQRLKRKADLPKMSAPFQNKKSFPMNYVVIFFFWEVPTFSNSDLDIQFEMITIKYHHTTHMHLEELGLQILQQCSTAIFQVGLYIPWPLIWFNSVKKWFTDFWHTV